MRELHFLSKWIVAGLFACFLAHCVSEAQTQQWPQHDSPQVLEESAIPTIPSVAPVPPNRIVNPVDEGQLVTLIGNTPPLARPRFDRGTVAPDLAMGDLVLVLRRAPEVQTAFDTYVSSQYDPKSANYHHWLTPAEVGATYGVSQSDIDFLSNWLRGNGFTVDEVAPDRMSIRFSGTSYQVTHAFHTEIHNLLVPTRDGLNERHISNMTDPKIPAALAGVVTGVKSLHNFFPRPLHRLGSQVTFDSKAGRWQRTGNGLKADFGPQTNRKLLIPGATPPQADLDAGQSSPHPDFGTVSSYGDTIEDVAPYDFAKIYNVLPLWIAGTPIDGTGQTIAIAGTSNINLADVAAFRKAFGLPAKAPSVVITNADPGTCVSLAASCLGDLIENSLDVEWAGAVAKGANIVLVTSTATTPTTDPLYLSESYVVQKKTANILNVSYGNCEVALGNAGNTEYLNLWQTAASEGIAVFVAAGDAGSPACDQGFDAIDGNPYAAQFGLAVSGLASPPYTTAVGGTDLNWGATAAPYWSAANSSATGANALGYIPEVVWNDTCANPLVLPSLAADATYIGVSGVVDAESACNFVIESGAYIQQNFGVDLSWLVDTVGGGGGASNCTNSNAGDPGTCSGGYAKPSWQTGVPGIPSDARRDIPDVSFFASNGFLGSAYLICVSAGGNACTYSATEETTAQEVGGTSVGSPAMAGVMALINQKAGAAQGNPNAMLYVMAANQSYSSCSSEKVTASGTCLFNDVDSGVNAMPCLNGSLYCGITYAGDPAGILTGYRSGAGYDLATGLGSLNVANVVNKWPLATAPVVSLSPTSLTFVSTVVGKSAATQTITLKNTGKSALTLIGSGFGISVTGANASSFSQTNTCGTSLAAAASCTITVTFKPAAIGALTAKISIGDNAFESPQTVALSGTGSAAAPEATLSAQSLTFGATTAGTTNTAPAITLTNSGSGTLTISSIAITGANSALFSQTHTCGATLAAGAACSISIVFKPTAAGSFTASLVVTDNASPTTQTLSLAGTGIAAAGVTVTPASLTFPSTTAGATSAAQNVTLKNGGTAAVTLTASGITFSGTNASSFKATTTCPSSLAASASCTISVTFKAPSAGTKTATMSIADSAANSPQKVTLTGTGVAAAVRKAASNLHAADAVPARSAQVARNYGNLPLRFEANHGQSNRQVKFTSRGDNYQLFLTAQEADLVFNHGSAGKRGIAGTPSRNPARTGAGPGFGPKAPSLIRMQLAGGSGSAATAGEEPLPGKTNYFLGSDPTQWRTGVPGYSRVRLSRVYPGIDLVYYGNHRQLEYDFVIAPGADPSPIRLHFAGADALTLDASGSLVIAAGEAKAAFHKPVVYQTIDGKRRSVSGAFRLLADNSAGFALGSYDHSQPLVIDPTLVYSTLLGGSTSDTMNSIAVDSTGNTYITGYTTSTDFPATPGALSVKDAESHTIAFVTKLNASGTALVYSTFLGGTGAPSGGEVGNAIAVDTSGDAYITGTTYSPNFPITTGVLQTTNKATSDSGSNGFVSKLNPTGTALLYSTYLGGSRSDILNSIAIDGSGNAYVAGSAFSNDIPTSTGAYQTSNKSYPSYGWNEYLAKLNPTATAISYGTFIGGSDEYSSPDNILVAVDASGSAYISGLAISTDFPTTSGAYQKTTGAKSGYSDLTVTKFNSTGTALVYSTYLGGSGGAGGLSDLANGLAVDSSGNVYLSGTTYEANFPVTKGAYQTTLKANSNAFVTKMNPSGSGLVYSTYLGGTGANEGDFGHELAIDSSGDVYLTGWTDSEDFPTTSTAYQKQNNAADNYGINAFLTEINPTGTALLYSTYFGGDDFEDAGYAIALSKAGNIYFTGQAGGNTFPTTAGAYETVYKSQYFTTGFVAEFSFGSAVTTKPTQTTLLSNANPAVIGTNMIYTVTVAPVTGTVVPTGNVVFNIDQVNVATVALNSSGIATYSTAPLKVGQHAILASYSGSSTYSASANNITETIVPATPTITPAGGTYPSAFMVTLGDGTSGTAIYYTTDGTTPTTSSTKYTSPFLVNESEAVQAIAVISGIPGSAISSAFYTLVSAPSSLAVSASALATTTATVNALVNTYGMSGTYYFRYGTSSTALGSVTPTKIFTSSTLGSRASFVPVEVSAQLTGLVTKTKYYYQVVITTPAGTSSGQILSFITN